MALVATAALVPLALAAEVLAAAMHHLLAAHVVLLLLLLPWLLLLLTTHVGLLLEATRVAAHVGLLLGSILPVRGLLAILVVSRVVRLLIVLLHS